MRIPMYQVDAFSNTIFGGNPAAVCPLQEWLDADVMQKIAMENNLSETAFYVKAGNSFEIRWFTPKLEIDLAGHPTLAASHVIFNHSDYKGKEISFLTRESGELTVVREEDRYVMDFPSRPPEQVEAPPLLVEALGKVPTGVYKARDYMVWFDSEKEVLEVDPDFRKLKQVDCFGVIVTAKGERSDFVSRFFVPHAGMDEDPVTGSAHTTLIPFWARELGKDVLHAFQVSERRGELFCRNNGDRVSIGGRAVTFFDGHIRL
ncbi:MAG: PhzF family phenazine biosynthesis protein [bacterium]|nr:PhzF family phenazine biosynthesis protein [bacterium]